MIREHKNGEERGGSKLNLLLTLCVLGAMVFVAAKIVPVYITNYQFQDSVDAESRDALSEYPKRTADDIQNDILNKAKGLGIPAQKDAIRVVVERGNVEIGLNYSVPIDLAVYQLNLQFHPHADNQTIYK